MSSSSNLEFAARKSLRKYIGKEESLTPLYLQPERAVFLAKASKIILKVYLESNLLKKEFEVAQKAKAVGIPLPEMMGLDIEEYTVLAMKQVIGTPLNAGSKNATQEAGKYLRVFHGIGANPPFSGGQSKWDEFVLWSHNRGFKDLEERNMLSIKKFLDSRD